MKKQEKRNIYKSFNSIYPKYRETEAEVYIADNVARDVSAGVISLLSNITSGLSIHAARSSGR